ncbi:MAG: L-fucose isomerase, partial [Clostridia bacterium]|nr:L-fucose isomerase [Clostridia bacterium]
TYWSPEAIKRVAGYELEGIAKDGIIHLINSGATTLDGTGQQIDKDGNPCMKPYWDITDEEAKRCLEATEFCPANAGYFRGGGFSSRFYSKGNMPVTMSRVNIIKGLGPVLQIAEGYTVQLPEEVHHKIDMRTDPSWPTTYFVPKTTGEGAFEDVYSVMNNWGANHGAISYGHIGDQLITLASMLRIPVSMHNVEDHRIFRPKAWAAYGTKDLESADFRACAAYGALYKK